MSEIVVQVVGRKVVGLENLPRLDASLFKEVDQEIRDVLGLRSCEVLVAMDVLVCVMRGCWAELLATISATGLTAAELADTLLLNHCESEVVGIIEVVQDHGVGLGEGLSLRGLKSSEDDGLENVSDIDVAGEEFQHFQSVSDIAEERSTSALDWPSQAMRRLNSQSSRTVCMRL